MANCPAPSFNTPHQNHIPGQTSLMRPKPDYGEQSYVGHDRLRGKIAGITGGDFGIGRAVAIAGAREGLNAVLSFLIEERDDTRETEFWMRKAGRRAFLVPEIWGTGMSASNFCGPDSLGVWSDRHFGE